MHRASVLVVLLATLAAAGAVHAQTCTQSAVIGNFQVDFQGAAFDGTVTQFDYCITGLAADKFRALSHWDLTLDTRCIEPGDLADCSTGNCYYQVKDPKLGITGIKFDEEDAEAGQTKCYSYSLVGDWTAALRDVEVGIKAGQNLDYGSVCGPTCRACKAGIQVSVDPSGAPSAQVSITHNRPVPVTSEVFFRLVDSQGVRLLSWKEGPVTFELGKTWDWAGPIPGVGVLEPGEYTLYLRLRGMSGWVERSAHFVVPAP